MTKFVNMSLVAMVPFLFASSLSAASINFMVGKVDVENGGRWRAAVIGMPLLAGDSVRTAGKSLAIIAFAGNAHVKLRENTVLSLEKLGDAETKGIELRITAGSVFSRVSKNTGRFALRAGTVVASVRGTEFFTAFGREGKTDSDIWLCVNEGIVEVSSETGKDAKMVKEGEGVLVTARGGISQPRKYEWTRGLNWNMQPESGAVEDTTDLEKAYVVPLDGTGY